MVYTCHVKKPRSDKLRLVQDVRKINIQTKDLSYPQLDIKALLAADIGSQNSKYFSIIDMKSAYNQIKLSDKSKMVACMSTPARVGKKPAYIRIVQAAGFYRL